MSMSLEKAVRIGLGLRAARSTEMAEALSVMANEIESRDSQKPIAVVDRTLGQMFVKWADGKSLYQVEVGTKLYSRPVGVGGEKIVGVLSDAQLYDLSQGSEWVLGEAQQYDWSQAPHWANWAVTHMTGHVYWYEKEPSADIHSGYWHSDGLKRHQVFSHWHDSKEKRPTDPTIRHGATSGYDKYLATTAQAKQPVGFLFQGDNDMPARECFQRPGTICSSDCSCPPALTVTAKTPMRYIETNEHLIDLRRVQCVSYVSDDSYRVTLVSGVTFPVDDKLYPRKNFIEQLVAYGSHE